MISLTNLIPSPSFEGSGWSGGSYSTARAMDGTRSLQINGSSGSPEALANTTANIQLNNQHLYYARVYGYQTTKTGGDATPGFYWPIAEPNFNDSIPLGPAGQWNLYSAVNNRKSFGNGGYQFRIDFNNKNQAGTIWYDCCMLIDLTAGFGAGNEPDKEWLDQNIPYFAGTTTLDIIIGKIVIIESASIVPNPANMNTQATLTVNVREETKVLAPEPWYANEIYSGEAS